MHAQGKTASDTNASGRPFKERSIIFSRPMVLALLNGSKTQTRRVMKPKVEPGDGSGMHDSTSAAPKDIVHAYRTDHKKYILAACPYGKPGDRLWVRETFFAFGHWATRHNARKGRDEWYFVDTTSDAGLAYAYDAPDGCISGARRVAAPAWWKRPPIFMPRIASRITLAITDVRCEQLRACSEADAIAEGILTRPGADGDWVNYAAPDSSTDALGSYRSLWEKINGTGSWARNPDVWVLAFKRA